MKRRAFLKLLPAALVALWRPAQEQVAAEVAAAQNGTPYGQGAYGSGPYGGFWAKFRRYLPVIRRD